MPLSLAKAELIGVFLEALSYGIYFSIFIQCIQVLRQRQSLPNDYLMGTAVSLYILITAHLVIDIMRNMDAFTTNTNTPSYAEHYYSTFDTWQNIVKSVLYVSVTLISDAFILYRSFIVWGRNYFVVFFPFLLFLADAAIGVLWIYTLSLVQPGDNVYTDDLSVRVKTFYSITLSMNFTCTCLIALKIWKIQRAVAPFAQGNQDEMSRLVVVIIESGSSYLAMLVIMLVTYTKNSPAMFIFLNTMCPVIGIVFSSVIVRIGLGLSHGDGPKSRSQTTSRMRWAVRASERHTVSGSFVTPMTVEAFPERGVQVALSHTVHTHVDGFPAVDYETELGSTELKRMSLSIV